MGYKKVFMQIKNFGSARLELVTKLAILTRANRGVAQLGSASALGAEGRRFKSCHPDHFRFIVIHSECAVLLGFFSCPRCVPLLSNFRGWLAAASSCESLGYPLVSIAARPLTSALCASAHTAVRPLYPARCRVLVLPPDLHVDTPTPIKCCIEPSILFG